MKEVRIGSVSWFAGVFWLLMSLGFQGLARVAFHTGEIRIFQRPAWWATWKLIHLANRTNKLAYTCALEAGAEE